MINKNVKLIALLSITFIAVIGLLTAMNGNNYFNFVNIRATETNRSITFNRSVSSYYEKNISEGIIHSGASKTSAGQTIYLVTKVSSGQIYEDNVISQFTNSDFNGLEEPVKFCWDKDGNDEVEFNYLSSITITYATSTKCRLKYSSDGSSWTTSDAGINGDTAFNLSGNKYVRLFKYGNADIVKITSLTLNYVC